MSKYLTAPTNTSGMPGGIPYIIGNEAAERFSFYGMKGVLVVFMTSYLFLLPGSLTNEPMPGPEAIEKYHTFTAWVYLTPIFGALISDIFLGKYLTIIILSLVYCLGHGALALMGLDEGIDPAWMLTLGLGLIAIGSGGIKPCVSAHVGDQFGRSNAHLLDKVFSWFYFSINVGAFLSTLMTPWFLEWYGPHLAFGVPGVLMVIATFLFWCGRKRFVHVPPGGIKWFKETFSWEGIGAILKLCVIYIFVAVFWALFDQTGSMWVLQAEDLNRNWLGTTWLPSQIQAVNPIMILIFIPLFTYVVYPLIDRVFPLTPIRKISIGLFVMVSGFAIAALVQQSIDAGGRPSIGWQILAYATLTASEVMVSITCLQFSYTQAPRTMKSVIMALFLMSVSLGNYFVAGVNAFILVDSNATGAKIVAAEFGREHQAMVAGETRPADAAAAAGLHRDRAHRAADLDENGGNRYAYHPLAEGRFGLDFAGLDGVIGSSDDIRLGFAPDGTMTGFENAEADAIVEGIERVGGFWEKEARLPDNDEGAELVADLLDPWGEPIRYLLVNSKSFNLTSDGPDSEWQSEFDIRAEVTVDSKTFAEQQAEAEQAAGGDLFAWAHPKETWIARRMREIEAAKGVEPAEGRDLEATESEDAAVARVLDENPDFQRSIKWDIGGANILSGASYFWFWTWLMLGTAVVFVPVGWLYRPRTYLQEEIPESGGSMEGTE
ncbi:MAG: MFS transporter [Planctomycetota bacterium]|nr:MFS transporter [Planctomycetota bacterium]